MIHNDKIADILRVEGVLAQGYGLSPKAVMRDHRLTIEAKGIYSYLASFAGNGNTSFPSRDLMIDEMNISTKRFYKHFKLLIDYGYLTVESQRDSYGSFARNIYTLVSNPVAKGATAPADHDAKGVTAGERKPRKSQKEKSESCLRKQMDIDTLIDQMPEQKPDINKIYAAARDMDMADTITISGTIRQHEYISDVLSGINADSVRAILDVLQRKKARKEKVRNTKAYIQALLCNISFDQDQIIGEIESNREEIERKKKMQEEDDERSRIDQIREETYKNHPSLEAINRQINSCYSKLVRSNLFTSEGDKQQYTKEIERLEAEKNKYIDNHGLNDFQDVI